MRLCERKAARKTNYFTPFVSRKLTILALVENKNVGGDNIFLRDNSKSDNSERRVYGELAELVDAHRKA
ncbi:hypothetical protein M2474_001007 [Dysgonomonas sp. PH5-37]|uniref:hypothetical protein n=1 Tax=Dysgonomonas sp. PH5-37 TaxID=2940648 RepID=UPI002474799C|nr:hypothetical protein [Dysgonomonas sp. PH5-37]MDH6387581.1 hypothetical protein [Dysgonomonas sp. PH5-37]